MYSKFISKKLLKHRLPDIKIHRKFCWVPPQGFHTGIKVYNCVTRQKEPLILKNKDLLTWYTCGPTVYDSSHIGHASAYVKLDIIQRILKYYFKYNLVTALNITDIDDKIIKRANELDLGCKDLTDKFENEFWEDLKSLGIEEPSVVLRVTENIPLIIGFIQKLVENDQAYKAADNSVYFSVNTVKKYGKLQNIGTQEEKQKPGYVKKSSLDFALWKASKEEGEPFWDSPWGKGRPGWHIECSALASNIFGSSIDVHAGGIDLRFPHHENEEAQSCAFHNTTQWVNYWIHTGHLHLNQSEKMSKSLRNTISIQEMLKSASAEDFRMSCVMSPYQNNMEYSEKLMKTARNTLETLTNCVTSCEEYKKGYLKATINKNSLIEAINKSVDNVDKALRDNFNTPSVIQTLNELVSTTNTMLYTSSSSDDKTGLVPVLAVKNLIVSILEVFGLSKNANTSVSKDFTKVVDILHEFRQEIRNIGICDKNKNLLKLCDTVRDESKKCGVTFKDHGKVSSWSM